MATEYLGTGLKRVADVALASGIATQHVGASVSAVRTSGYSQHGKGAATYVSDSLATSALAAAHPRFCKQSLDGRYWRLALEGGLFDVMSGGAQGNGSTDDYAAIQAAINYALTFSSATIRFPAGTYPVSASPEIVHGRGLNLVGAGPDNTVIRAGAFPAMKTKGLWRSRLEGLAFWCDGNATSGAFDLDGETDGSFGTQGNVFANCMFFGNYNSKYVFTVALVSGGYGQGSENVWIGCAFQGSGHNAGDALFYNSGTNALQNTLLTCNFQGFITGIKIGSGAVDILHCGFQSTYGYEQIEKGGFDVDCSTSGLGDTITMTGCRTESMRIYKGGGCPAQITGFAHTPGAGGSWYSGAKTVGFLVRGQTAAGNLKLYRCTTAGTGGTSEPTWPESGTVADGSVVWTQTDFNVFDNVTGRIANGQMMLGQFGMTGENVSIENVLVTRDDCVDYSTGHGGIAGPGPRMEKVRIGAGAANGTRPIKIGNNATAGARNSNPRFVNFSDQSLVWTEGLGGGTYHDISIRRAGGSFYDKAANYFGLTGGWGFAQVAFADLVAVAREGVTYYVTDGMPGSSPLTGAGAGCLAVYQNGAWRAVNLGAGLISTDGAGGIILGAPAPGVPAVTLVNGAGCTVGANWITCTSASGWNSAGAYSSESYTGNVTLLATVSGGGVQKIIGLNSDPASDNNWNSIDYGVYFNAGTLVVLESGGGFTSGPAAADGDVIGVRRSGTNIEYLHNGTVWSTTTGVSASTPLYLDAVFNNSVADGFTNIRFGPTSSFAVPSVVMNGVMKPDSVTLSALAGITPQAGDQIFVSDGTPGSSPLAGGGTGCMAVYQNGAWRALTMGSPVIADGDKGDVAVSGGGATWTIDSNAVTNAKMADMATATFKGRATAGNGDPEDLTGTQATALLNTFTSGLKGLAPASGGGTTNFLRADGAWAAPAVTPPGGSSGDLQYNNAGAFAGAGNVKIETGNLKLVSTSDPAAPTGGLVHYSRLHAGRHLPMTRSPAGIAQALQGAMHGASIAHVGLLAATTFSQIGITLTSAGTITQPQTIASANPWQATARKRLQTAATAAASAGARTAYTQWFRGSAAGFGGFFFRAQFGQNLNVSGAQCFIGLCASTAALATTAGAVAALTNMIGVGYDTTDASTGNWQLYRNDGTGTATKVDLGATNAARNTTHGYDLIIYCPPGVVTDIYVRIVNLHTGATVIDTSYTTDLPAVDTGLAMKCDCNNGAVAAAVNIEFAKIYIESDY